MLNAETAMIRQADETPVTYLNKGHIYSVSIVDTAPTRPGPTSVLYRISIRISFGDGQQEQIPAARWQLWKEGRGTDEAHQLGGKLQGVEYVETRSGTEDDSRTKVNLETTSIDGFSVLWTRGLEGSADCHFAVRFNFLSTDFSHSKGVKGILSRLCSKTEVISTHSLHYSLEVPEICFCEVKVFRDHGAERKLSNDIAYIKKIIDKRKQEISQFEARMKESGKTNRDGSIAMKFTRSTEGEVPRHKTTWPMSFPSSTEEDLHSKLQTMQEMVASIRPVSALCIRGQEQDDPDLYPVQLTDEPLDLTKVELRSTAGQQIISGHRLDIPGTATLMSSLPSPGSAISQGIARSRCDASVEAEFLTHSQRGGFQPMQLTGSELQQPNTQYLLSPPDQPMGIQMPQQHSSCTSARWIEPLRVGSSSRPPLERPVKPG